jgi:hypothetical protein
VVIVEWHHPVAEDLGGGDRRLEFNENGSGFISAAIIDAL